MVSSVLCECGREIDRERARKNRNEFICVRLSMTLLGKQINIHVPRYTFRVSHHRDTDLFADGVVPEDEGTLFGMKLIVPLVGYAYSNEVSSQHMTVERF